MISVKKAASKGIPIGLLHYLGEEVEFYIDIEQDGRTKVLKINDIDVRDKNIYI